MKRLRPHSRSHARKVVCTVSAAALMLGVSQAATVGFNFQCNYCAAPSYAGSPVTAPAFGLGTNRWESLTPMDTGYGCAGGCSPFTLNQVIDTTTSGDGLNPLPSGSLSVTWFGSSANVSGFGGYNRWPAHPGFEFGGNSYQPGEEQVYWGFLRDGVNFGPMPPDCGGAPNGDNNEPGYSVDLAGLKSVWTHSPFVVELIASSDSAWSMTNAFVIDATSSTTQTVVYANFAPIRDQHNAMMPRGIGGGLSTPSGALDTDHVVITGNQAQHGATFNNASTIAGFIITDQPVVTMSPRSVLATGGDTVTLRSIAIGVPPLSCHWRKGGVAIPGATNLSYTIPGITSGGDFDLVVTNLYGAATSKVASVTVDRLSIVPGTNFVLDSKPSGIKHDGADSGATWLASSSDTAGVNRQGVMKFVATDPDQVVLPASSDFTSPQGTIMFWMRSAGVNTSSGNEGAMLVDRRTSSGVVLVQADDGTVLVQSAGSVFTEFNSFDTVTDNKWHHVALVYDQTVGGTVALYLDGTVQFYNNSSVAWAWPAGQEIELGHSHDAYWRSYDGLMDDVRIYSRILTDAEIAAAFSSDALVDTPALQVRLNFDTAPVAGATIGWQSTTPVLQSADAVNGPWSDLLSVSSPYYVGAQLAKKFYRYRYTPVSIATNPYDM